MPNIPPFLSLLCTDTPSATASPNFLGEEKTGKGVMRVLRTRITPFPELIPPFPLGRGVRGEG